MPLRAMLYVRQKTMAAIPKKRRWGRFATKLQLAARLVEWIVPPLKNAGKTVWVVIDGGYTKRPFLRRALKTGVTIVGRLRKDAALRDLPPKLKKGQRRGRGRPRKYGKNKLSLARPPSGRCPAGQKRGWQTAECILYGKTVTKTYKTFLATYPPVGRVIRVVLVQEDHGWFALFCTDPDASVVASISERKGLEAFADRATIEQALYHIKAARRERSVGERANNKCARTACLFGTFLEHFSAEKQFSRSDHSGIACETSGRTWLSTT